MSKTYRVMLNVLLVYSSWFLGLGLFFSVSHWCGLIWILTLRGFIGYMRAIT